jgi:hypothetical protein
VVLQRHQYIANYLTESDWNTVQAPDVDFGLKLQTVIRRALQFGLNHATESTYTHVVSVILAAQKQFSISSTQAPGRFAVGVRVGVAVGVGVGVGGGGGWNELKWARAW